MYKLICVYLEERTFNIYGIVSEKVSEKITEGASRGFVLDKILSFKKPIVFGKPNSKMVNDVLKALPDFSEGDEVWTRTSEHGIKKMFVRSIDQLKKGNGFDSTCYVLAFDMCEENKVFLNRYPEQIFRTEKELVENYK